MSDPTKKCEEFQAVIDAGKKVLEGLPHFYDCIDFNKSHLDSEAIRWMNECPGKLALAIHHAERM